MNFEVGDAVEVRPAPDREWRPGVIVDVNEYGSLFTVDLDGTVTGGEWSGATGLSASMPINEVYVSKSANEISDFNLMRKGS